MSYSSSLSHYSCLYTLFLNSSRLAKFTSTRFERSFNLFYKWTCLKKFMLWSDVLFLYQCICNVTNQCNNLNSLKLTSVISIYELVSITFSFRNLVAVFWVVERRIIGIMITWWRWRWFRTARDGKITRWSWNLS